MKELTVYCLTHNVTNKKYVGSSYKIASRINQHISSLLAGKHPNAEMQKDNDDYGFSWSVTIICKEFSDNRNTEYEYINKLQTTNPDIGYNKESFFDENLFEYVDNLRNEKKKLTRIRTRTNKINAICSEIQNLDFSDLPEVIPQAELSSFIQKEMSFKISYSFIVNLLKDIPNRKPVCTKNGKVKFYLIERDLVKSHLTEKLNKEIKKEIHERNIHN